MNYTQNLQNGRFVRRQYKFRPVDLQDPANAKASLANNCLVYSDLYDDPYRQALWGSGSIYRDEDTGISYLLTCKHNFYSPKFSGDGFLKHKNIFVFNSHHKSTYSWRYRVGAVVPHPKISLDNPGYDICICPLIDRKMSDDWDAYQREHPHGRETLNDGFQDFAAPADLLRNIGLAL